MCGTTSAPTASMTNVRIAIVSLVSIRDFQETATDTKQAEIEHPEGKYPIPPKELGRKGEYQPHCARCEKQQRDDGNQVDAMADNGLLAAKWRRNFHTRYS